MRSNVVCRVILIIFMVVENSQGCSPHGVRRKKRYLSAPELSETLAQFFGSCPDLMTASSGVLASLQSAVDYSIRDTNWYDTVSGSLCVGSSNTTACWIDAVKFLIDETSPLYNATEECIYEWANQNYARRKKRRSEPFSEPKSPGPNALAESMDTLAQNYTVEYPSLNRTDSASIIEFTAFHYSHCRAAEIPEYFRSNNTCPSSSEDASWRNNFTSLFEDATRSDGPMYLIFQYCIDNITSTCSEVDWASATQVTEALDMEVTCTNNYMEARITVCILIDAGYDIEEDITINGPENVTSACNSLSIMSIGDTWIARVYDPFSECNTVITRSADNSTYSYSNAVSIFQFSNLNEDPVIRKRHVYLPFTCEYQAHYDDVQINGFSVEQEALSAYESEESGEFEHTIRFCEDENCTQEISSGDDLVLLDDVYLVIESEKRLNAYIQGLAAYSDETDSPEYNYTIIDYDTNCLTPMEVADGSAYEVSDYKTVVRFRAFKWPDSDLEIYLIAEYSFCDPEFAQCENPCEAESGTRRRRRATNDLENPTISTTLGPWRTI